MATIPPKRTPPAEESEYLSHAAEAAKVFPGLSETDLLVLFRRGRTLILIPGERLFSAGEPADRLWIVLAGRINLEFTRSRWSERYTSGDWLGEFAFAAPDTRLSASAIAETAARVLEIDQATCSHLETRLQDYLTQRILETNRACASRLREHTLALARHNAALTDALYEKSTRSSKDFTASVVAQQIFARIPALPVSSTRLLNRMLDDQTSQNEIVDAISQDVALTGTLLKAVNAPAYGLQHKITSVSHAILLLGHHAVYQIIMAESLRCSLPNTPAFHALHRRAFERSRLAFVFAQTLGLERPAEIATLALLRDIGLVVIELLKQGNPRLSILFDALSQAEMGAALLRSWRLPEQLCLTLQYHSHAEFSPPSRLPPAVRTRVAALHIIGHIHQRLLPDETEPSLLFTQEYMEALGLHNLDKDELFEQRLLPRLRTLSRSLPATLAARIKTL